MGATKLNLKQIQNIATREVVVEAFELGQGMDCNYTLHERFRPGDVVLIKASFVNACQVDGDPDNVLYRRRVVPFVTRVCEAEPTGRNGDHRVRAAIEKITEDDRRFFFDKFHGEQGDDEFEFEVEGRHIRFAAVDEREIPAKTVA